MDADALARFRAAKDALPTEDDPIATPRFFRAEERALAKAQRKH